MVKTMETENKLLINTICEYMRALYEHEPHEICDINTAIRLAYWEGRYDFIDVLLRNGGSVDVLAKVVQDKKDFDAIRVVE